MGSTRVKRGPVQIPRSMADLDRADLDCFDHVLPMDHGPDLGADGAR